MKKKKNLFSMILILCIILFTTTACPDSGTDRVEPEQTPVLTVSPTSIAFGPDKGESQAISVVAKLGDNDASWNLSLDSDAQNFIKASMTSGNGSSSLVVTTTSENTGSKRSGTITISTSQKTVIINVTQDASTTPGSTDNTVSGSAGGWSEGDSGSVTAE